MLITPLLAELERIFPGAEIDVLVAGSGVAEIFDGFRSVRTIYALPRFILRHVVASLAVLAKLRAIRYDLAIDASKNSNSSRLILGLVTARLRIGLIDARNVTPARQALLAPTHLAVLPVFVLRHMLKQRPDSDEPPYPQLDVRLSSRERCAARESLEALLYRNRTPQSCVTLGVFANATGRKRYEESWWLQFVDAVTIARSDVAIVELIAADGLSRLDNRFPAFYSNSPRRLCSFISNLTCFISGDCGVMHLASASGATTIGLFSVSDASKYEPRGGLNRALATRDKSLEEIARSVVEIISLSAQRDS